MFYAIKSKWLNFTDSEELSIEFTDARSMVIQISSLM